jgi:heme/copper-type cytochrome/quinol oxidase subunit 3
MPWSFLMSSVTLFAYQYMAYKSANPVRGAAWYEKQRPTFSDALALVRKELLAREATFCRSLAETAAVKVPRALKERLTDAVCYAA